MPLRVPTVFLCLLAIAATARAESPAAPPREEIVEHATLGPLRLVAKNAVRDPLLGDLEGAIYSDEAKGKRQLLHRKGAVVGTCETVDLGGGPMLAVAWIGGGKARYLVPELYRAIDGSKGDSRLEKVWGPFDDNPLQEGEMLILESDGRGKVVLEETLTYHSHVPPHLVKTTPLLWKDGRPELEEPSYAAPESPHQKCNLAYEYYTRGDHARSLRLYLESIQEGEKEMLREDPELAAALHYAVAANFEKLGEARQQRVYLDRVATSWPDTSYARKAGEKLMRLKGKELGGP